MRDSSAPVSPRIHPSSTKTLLFFYGANTLGAKVSQGLLDQIWLLSMQAGVKNVHECIQGLTG